MDSVDMLDVLHYYFEEDLTFESEEHADNKTRLRKMLYDTLYDKDYIWGTDSSSSGQNFDFDTDDGFVNNPAGGQIPMPVNPAERAAMSQESAVDPPRKPKRYIAPTEFNADSAMPFGKLLDPPMQ